MFYKAAIAAVAISIAAPAFANDDLADRLDLPRGVYTLNELVQIRNATGPDRAVRIELINKQRASFDAAVQRAMDIANGS